MITGSNTNIRHGGKLFHIQTEDSGRRNPHVISHLYFGGTILASQKTRYAELLDLESETIDKDVKLLMDEQHKLMLERLRGGVYDDVIADRLGGDTGGTGSERIEPTPEPAVDATPAAAPEVVRKARAFGDGIGSQKPLDELILEYLVEKAHDRNTERAAPEAKRSSEKG